MVRAVPGASWPALSRRNGRLCPLDDRERCDLRPAPPFFRGEWRAYWRRDPLWSVRHRDWGRRPLPVADALRRRSVHLDSLLALSGDSQRGRLPWLFALLLSETVSRAR